MNNIYKVQIKCKLLWIVLNDHLQINGDFLKLIDKK